MTPRRVMFVLIAYIAAIWLVFGIAVYARGETVLLVVTQDGCGPCVQQRPLAQAAARATGVRFVEHNITRQGTYDAHDAAHRGRRGRDCRRAGGAAGGRAESSGAGGAGQGEAMNDSWLLLINGASMLVNGYLATHDGTFLSPKVHTLLCLISGFLAVTYLLQLLGVMP
jgi:hypothetical protein